MAMVHTSFVELLRARTVQHPDKLAFAYLRDGREESESITFAQLDQQARAIGAQLQSLGATGKRAMVLYPTGLDVIAAILGCLYAGVIAIPAPPPEASRLRWTMPRLQAIIKDAEISLVLSTGSILELLESAGDDVAELRKIQKLDTALTKLEQAEQWVYPDIGTDTLAYLQYTSGSTSSPKGVMISHGNLLHNCDYINKTVGYNAESVSVTWLPYFHDYGLVEGLLEPLYNGTPCYLLSPYSFVKQPFYWLQAISRYRASHSGGPNFAYALCLRRIKPEQRATLNLDNWTSAGIAAEPINPAVMEAFNSSFEPQGFKWRSFSPAYGMSETTLAVSSTPVDQDPKIYHLDKYALEAGTVVATERGGNTRTLVGCGRLMCDTNVVIVDPETRQRCAPDVIGEIWISDPSVAQGYWRRPEDTEQTFQAHTADTGEGPFLRTGDLGFLDQGEVVVCGRAKDVIIIRGSNHSPQDIEWTVQECHAALRPENTAAFSVNVGGEERLVIAQEVIGRFRRNLDVDEIVNAIRESVSLQHELDVYAVVLLNPGGVEKTSSGKIQRQACRQMFLEGKLNSVAEWTESIESDLAQPGEDEVSPKPPSPNADYIQSWLQAKVAGLLNINPDQLDVGQPFARYGLDSIRAVTLAGELEAWLGISIPPTVAYDYPNIRSLARYLGGSRTETSEQTPGYHASSVNEPIAIIGLGCRFPGTASADGFWQQLHDRRDSITEVPLERWNPSVHYDPEQAKPGKMNTRWGGFIDQVDEFDAGFFGISPREANYMDPQQRLLLEVGWEALENAGIAPSSLANSRTGVFIGISSYDYGRLQSRSTAGQEGYSPTGTALSIAANRLSYAFDLRGPSVAIDTACSSSLVAVHQACQSLRLGESELVLAGGVNVILDPASTIAFSQARMMASDGHCKTFSADADGYVRSEGCGIVALKRLADAVRDGNEIFAVIRGSAVNQDGRSNGLTAPNGTAQQDVIRSALENAAVEPSQIGYVEAHGTGTPLGDPIELNSLMGVLSPGRTAGQRCWVGSVKTNIGHLEAAAGIAGLIKATLCLHRREIPPNLHFAELNPHISIDAESFAIPTDVQPWKKEKHPRFAGVSSFGFGGTNAHVILEEGPAEVSQGKREFSQPSYHLLQLSAMSEPALQDLAARYEKYLIENGDLPVENICHTTITGRAQFKQRLAVVGASNEELREKLAVFRNGESAKGIAYGRVRNEQASVAFMFTGQGSQYIGMGRQLYETQTSFRRTIDQCDEILREVLGNPLLRVLYPAGDESSPLDQTGYTQPCLFALEYALTDMLMSWGIKPTILLGHSVGEYVAACVAGIFTLEDGLRLIAKRAALMQALPREGEMLSVLADEKRVTDTIAAYKDDISIAAVNGPESIVVSGRTAAIRAIADEFSAAGIDAIRLNVSHAFHSPLMEPMLAAFEIAARGVTYKAPSIPLVSNMTGELISDEIASPDYWVRHVRRPVRFADGIQAAITAGARSFVEIGPKPTLCGLGRNCVSDKAVSWLPGLVEGQSDWQRLMWTLGDLFAQGVSVDAEKFARDFKWQKVVLPSYPFQRQRYTYDDEAHGVNTGTETAGEISALLKSKNPEQLLQQIGTLDNYSDDERSMLAKLLNVFLEEHHRRQSGKQEVVSDYYDELTEALTPIDAASKRAGESGAILNFAAFAEVIPGFSWVQAFFSPEEYPEQAHALIDAQRLTRAVLFRNTDLSACNNVLDFGCGHGSDLIRLAEKNGHLKLKGFTISPDQAELGNKVAAERGVQNRVTILNCDSSKDEFPPGNDLILGFEVACHIQNKEALFGNIDRNLRDGGQLLLADFISRAEFEIAHLETSSYLVTLDEWVDLFSRNHLVVKDHIDISQPVANFFYDPEGEKKLLENERINTDVNVKQAFHSYSRLGKMLSDGLTSYVLLTLEKDLQLSEKDLRGLNAERLRTPEFYEDAYPDRWLYELQWRPVPCKQGNGRRMPDKVDAEDKWLIFSDRSGTGQTLARELAAQQAPFALVFTGTQYERVEPGLWNVNPTDPADFHRLFGELENEWGSPSHIVHLWSLDAPSTDELTGETLEQAQRIGAGSIAPLAQGLEALSGQAQARCWFVTRGALSIDSGQESVNVSQAPVWGAAKVFSVELPQYWGGLVDLDCEASENQVKILLAELVDAKGEDQLAFRNGARYAARLARTSRPEAAALSIHADASYLITGGLGGLGIRAGRWLVEQGARNLILTGRSGVSSRSTQEAVETLHHLGARVTIHKADVADRQDMQQLVSMIDSSMPPLRGIIHAAGVAEIRALKDMTWQDFDQITKPKVLGTWNIHELTRDMELDFIIGYSSIASVWGPKGSGHYAAGNQFLDSYAQLQRSDGTSVRSINWGPWGGGGMATDEALADLSRSGVYRLHPAQAADMLGVVLKADTAQTIVARVDWEVLGEAYEFRGNRRLMEEMRTLVTGNQDLPVSNQNGITDLLAKDEPEGRRHRLADYLNHQAASVLGFDESTEIDDEITLLELGFDSLMAVQLRNIIRKQLDIDLELGELFQSASLNEVTDQVYQRLTL